MSGADPELLAAVTAAEGVETEDALGLGEVARTAWTRAADRVAEWLDGLDVADGAADATVLAAMVGAAALGGVLVAVLVGLAVRARRRRPAPAPRAAAGGTRPPVPAEALEAALAAGDAVGALRALWAEAGRAAAARGGARFERDTTVRELVAAVEAVGWERAPQVRELGRAVERHLYAGEPPTLDAVRRLVPLARAIAA